MTEDLKKMLEESLKNAKESLKNAKESMASGRMTMTDDFLDSMRLAMISQEIGNAIKEHVIIATKFFVEKNNLPKEEFFDYLIYGTVASTIRTLWDCEDDDDCECENCHCQPPKKPSSDNGSARAEADSEDAAIAAINALKDLLSKNG